MYTKAIRSAMLYGSETWCLGQNEIRIFQTNSKSHGEKYVWSEINEQEVDKRSNQVVHLLETIEQLEGANSARWYAHVS